MFDYTEVLCHDSEYCQERADDRARGPSTCPRLQSYPRHDLPAAGRVSAQTHQSQGHEYGGVEVSTQIYTRQVVQLLYKHKKYISYVEVLHFDI